MVHLDADGDLDLISAVQASGNVFWFENQGRMIRPGDANQNGRFERLDPVAVLQAGKYRTGQTATWDEGDWNGDRRFDSLDVVVALDTKQLSGRFE